MKRLATWAIIVFGFVFVGCNGDKQKADVTLRYLERGKFKGHITVTTTPTLGAGWGTRVWFGADKSAVAAAGAIDFSGHESDETTVADTPVDDPE